MIFRQLFDSESSTYTYLIGSRRGGEALLIDLSVCPNYAGDCLGIGDFANHAKLPA